MCHLSVPWQPPSIPQKYPKVVFDGFCMLLAKCCKQIGKPGRPKVLNLLSRPMWKRWFWRATLHFFGIDVPGCAILVFRSSLPKHIWPPKKPFHPLLVPMWNSRFWGSAVHFFALERVEKNQPPSNHPNVVHVLAPPMWKKVVFAAVFIFLGQDVPGCAILLFPGNPPAIPQKYPKRWLLHVFAKCRKKIGKSGRPKVLNLLLRPTWKMFQHIKKVVLRRYASFLRHRRTWMCHLSVPQQHPTSGVEINLASQKRFTPCCFLCETVGFEVLLFIFCNGKGGKKPSHPNLVHVIVPPMWKRQF